MKLLQTKDNVDAPDATYPYGTMRDRALGTPGSKVNTEFMTDYVQFFEKMFAESGLTANGLPDNFTNGFQLWEAARIAIKGYKVYSANVSQNFTNNPIAVPMVNGNELGTVTYTRTGVGTYEIDFASSYFTNANEYFILIGAIDNGLVKITYGTDSKLILTTKDLGAVLTDGIISSGDFYIEIRSYIV